MLTAFRNDWAAHKVDIIGSDSIMMPISRWDSKNREDAATILKAGRRKGKNPIWWYIHGQLFCPENLSHKEIFFSTDEVQRKLIKGIIEGTLDDEQITEALKICTPNLGDPDQIVQNKLDALVGLLHKRPSMSFIFRFFGGLSNEAQNKLADTLLAGKFGTNTTILQEIIKNLKMFADSEARLTVAKAIRQEKFGSDAKVLKALVEKFDCLGSGGTYVGKVQQELASAIREGKFGTSPEVLIEIANRFDIFSRPGAQRTVAQAINSRDNARIFGNKANVLTAVAKKLNCFTTTEARSEIAVALLNDVFGTDAGVLKEVASHLGMFAVVINPNNFANSDGEITNEMHASLAQSVVADLKMQFASLDRVAEAIYRAKFGNDVLVQRELATHLDIFKPVEGNAESIVFAKFDDAATTSVSFETAAAHLREVPEAKKINDVLQEGVIQQVETPRKIARAFSENRFISDPDVQRGVARNLALFTVRPGLVIATEREDLRNETQRKFLAFFLGGYFTDSQAKLDSQEFLAKYIEQGQLSSVVVAERTLLKTVVENFCDTRDLSPNTVTSLLSALASGKFNVIDLGLKIELGKHLESLLKTAEALTKAIDSATKKSLAIQFSKDVNNLTLLPVQIFLAQSINEIDFDTNNVNEKTALEAIVRKFCEPGVNISADMATHLQQAWHNKRFATIDPTLKAQFQAKLKIWSTLGRAVVVASSVLSVIGAAAGAYSYYYYFNGNGGGEG